MRLFCGNACWQVARRSRVKTTVPTSGSSAKVRASYYCGDYSENCLTASTTSLVGGYSRGCVWAEWELMGALCM